jgi:hypothetical protein
MSKGFDDAAADRQLIREEMSKGFDDARDERKAIEDGARFDRKAIRDEARVERTKIEGEIVRQNQNYIEHLAHHNTKKANPDSEEDDST